MMNRRVTFSEDGARRIARAVQAHERGNRDQPPITFRSVSDDADGIRLGKVSATWNKGSTATVTRHKGDGTAVSPAETFTATNRFATVTVTSGSRYVACANIGGTWHLIAAECA